MKAALWFILEPLMIRNESYSFGFYKALIEKVKNSKDALEPDNEALNKVFFTIFSRWIRTLWSRAALSNPFATRHMWRMAYFPNILKFSCFEQNLGKKLEIFSLIHIFLLKTVRVAQAQDV